MRIDAGRLQAARFADEKWYVLELHRDKVPVAEANLKAQGFQIFHPVMWVTVNQFGKLVKRLRPVFPGYCFVRCSLGEGRLRAIRSTRGVKRFAGPPGAVPACVPERIVASLIARCPDGVLAPSADDLKIGEEVRLEDCAFAGTLARIHELEDPARISVLISLFGTERIVSVPRAAVQPVVLRL